MTTVIEQVEKETIKDWLAGLDGDVRSETFQQMVACSAHLYTGMVNGKLLCLWGLVPPTLISDRAYLWLHTTPEIEGHEFLLVRKSQIEVGKMLEHYPTIIGHCLVDAERSIRWLKWLGARFGESDGKLIPFTIRKKLNG